MDHAGERIILFIDNSAAQLRLFTRYLADSVAKYLGPNSNLAVQGVHAEPHLKNYLKYLHDPRVVTIIIDQVLGDQGGVDHTGIDLATYLRKIDSIRPIYILTGHPDEAQLASEGWAVEDILVKGDLVNEDDVRLKTIFSRLGRRINLYETQLDEREARFRDLLVRSLRGELSEEEQQELDQLEYARAAMIMIPEESGLNQTHKLDEILEQLQAIASELHTQQQSE